MPLGRLDLRKVSWGGVSGGHLIKFELKNITAPWRLGLNHPKSTLNEVHDAPERTSNVMVRPEVSSQPPGKVLMAHQMLRNAR